jgi:hypothetical protein
MNLSDKKKDIFYILIIGVLSLLIIYQYIRYGDQQQKIALELQGKEYELVKTFSQLDSLSGELGDRIEEIDALGGDVDSLKVLQAQLIRDKRDLQRGKRLSEERYAQLQDRLEGFTELLKKKDQELVELRKVNDVLLTENIELKTQEVALKGQIKDLSYERAILEKKVEKAGDLVLDDIQFAAVANNGKEFSGDKLKVRQLRKLKIGLRVEPNEFAKVGPKTIYAKIIEPTGSTMYNQDDGSGTFTIDGEEVFFSAKKEFLFDNTGQDLNLIFTKGSLYTKGKYTVEFYSESQLLATETFIAL